MSAAEGGDKNQAKNDTKSTKDDKQKQDVQSIFGGLVDHQENVAKQQESIEEIEAV